MGIGVSLLVAVVGAVLTWGVTGDIRGLEITPIGVIVMDAGIVGLVLTFIFWGSWWGPGHYRRRSQPD